MTFSKAHMPLKIRIYCCILISRIFIIKIVGKYEKIENLEEIIDSCNGGCFVGKQIVNNKYDESCDPKCYRYLGV